MSNFRHGHKSQDGASPEYICWNAIRARCSNPKNPNYARYGARGITVCDEWKNNFLSFLADMGPRPSLAHSVERIDNDGNYEPSNCKWATKSEQANNRRSSTIIEMCGERKTLAEWCRVNRIAPSTVCQRMNYGWKVERALTAPVRGKTWKHI